MRDETFLRRAIEEDSQSISAGEPPLERCPACQSDDVGSNVVINHRRFYCRECTTAWSPNIVHEVLRQREQKS